MNGDAFVQPDYDDLVLVVDGRRARGTARVVVSDGGEGSTTFRRPATARDRAFLDALDRYGDDDAAEPGWLYAEATAFGSRLFAAVFKGSVLTAFDGSADLARVRGRGLRIRLRCEDAWAELPWEYLRDTRTGVFLGVSSQTPIVRHLEVPRPLAAPVRVAGALRILVVMSAPIDREGIDIDGEWRSLEASVGGPRPGAGVSLHPLRNPTHGRLLDAIRTTRPHVVHYIGHAEATDDAGGPVLIMENKLRTSRPVPGAAFAALLTDREPLRVVFLNACQGARPGPRGTFSGVAQTLSRQGVPAVVAMQFRIEDRAATSLAAAFYKMIADGRSLEVALAEARQEMLDGQESIGFGAPVLYMRAASGVLFDVAGGAPRLSDAAREQAVALAAPVGVKAIVPGAPGRVGRRRKSPKAKVMKRIGESVDFFVELEHESHLISWKTGLIVGDELWLDGVLIKKHFSSHAYPFEMSDGTSSVKALAMLEPVSLISNRLTLMISGKHIALDDS